MENSRKMAIVRMGPAIGSPAGTAARFWSMAETGEDEAEITMYGEIVCQHPVDFWTGEPESGMFISPEGFLEDLERIRGKGKITIRLCSIGGDLYTGIAIYNQLKDLKGQKTVIVDGVAASAASVIAMAGDVRRIHVGDTIMVHDPSLQLRGSYNPQEVKGFLKMLDASSRAAAGIYAAGTGLSEESIRSMMAKTTWMVGQEAVDKGFATELIDEPGPQMAMSADRTTLMVNGYRFSMRGLANIPGRIPVQAVPSEGELPLPENKIQSNEQGGKVKMTLEELRAQHPELVTQIEDAARASARAEASAAEQERLRAIDEIAPGVGNPALVAAAKYGDAACTAQELAFRALQAQAKQGRAHLSNIVADYTASGAGQVGAVPHSGAGEGPEDEAGQIQSMVEAFKQMKGGELK